MNKRQRKKQMKKWAIRRIIEYVERELKGRAVFVVLHPGTTPIRGTATFIRPKPIQKPKEIRVHINSPRGLWVAHAKITAIEGLEQPLGSAKDE